MLTPNVRTWSGLKPSSTRWRRTKLRTITLQPITSRSAIAISTMTSVRRARSRAFDPVIRFEPSFNAPWRSVFFAWRIGARPNRSDASTEQPTANMIAVLSRVISLARGADLGISAVTPSRAQTETRMPRPPPRMPSTRLSVTNWRTRRRRLAPRACRTATSRVRVSARASSKFATFTIEMSRTNSTAPWSSQSVVASDPTRSCWYGTAMSGCFSLSE